MVVAAVKVISPLRTYEGPSQDALHDYARFASSSLPGGFVRHHVAGNATVSGSVVGCNFDTWVRLCQLRKPASIE